MHDLARSKEFNKRYPKLAPQVQVKLMDAAPAILTTFDESLSKYAAKKFKRDVRESGFAVRVMGRLKAKPLLPQGIDVLTSRKVLRVEHNKIVTEQDGESESSLAYSYTIMAIDTHSF
jgi:NADH dehydrogenase FAD-containing subunit